MHINMEQSHGIIQALADAQLLEPEKIQLAINAAKKVGQALIPYLITHYNLNTNAVADALAQFYHLPRINLQKINLNQFQTNLIETSILQKYILLPLQQPNQTLQVAISDPTAFTYLDQLEFQTGLKIQPMIADYEQLATIINLLFSSEIYTKIKTLSEINFNVAEQDTPLVAFINQVITDAIHRRASDIHFEPLAEYFRIRMRIDGLLYKVATIPKHLANTVTSRLKIMSDLDITEKRLAQDGRLTFQTPQGLSRDCRLNCCPTQFGEKIVLRILNPNKQLLNIDELGFEEKQQQQFLTAVQRPQGLILVTGPTGSGKTVTLYSALNILNSESVNISTIEDPIEIQLAGVNQINVNYKIGFNFSTILRTLLRQDPDILMVGEIRDKETAEMAIRASQTGHLVLSTLHTNNASETLTRLVNMGIAAFNITSALTLIVAQRLIRTLCEYCKQLDTPCNQLLKTKMDKITTNDFATYKAVGCAHCTNGYKGRIGIFEMLPVTKTLSEQITENHRTNNIINYMHEKNIHDLWRAGLNKVIAGVTSLSEIYRVAS